MADLHLQHLSSVNDDIIQQHSQWLAQNCPSSIQLSKIAIDQYSILDYPQLWSGARLWQSSIAGKQDKPAVLEVQELIDTAKKINKKDKKALIELVDFEKKYVKYQLLLKERALLQAVLHSLNEIKGNSETKTERIGLIQQFRDTLNKTSHLNRQTRFNCLQDHKKINSLSRALNLLASDSLLDRGVITQAEVLAKRLIDSHYEHAKKVTVTEALSGDLETAVSFLGLATGIPAAGLAIAGIFFPPLLAPAAILGAISFISYAASIISAVKMANEAINYGRGPSRSDVIWLAIDTVLAPFNFMGGTIFSAVSKAFNPNHVKHMVNTAGFLWNSVISNVFPDSVEIKEVATKLVSVGATFRTSGQLKNETSASSWQKIRGVLAEHDRDPTATVARIKNEIRQNPNHETALAGRDFAYVRTTKNLGQSSLLLAKSFHAHLLMWDRGFVSINTSQEAQLIKDDIRDYKQLKPDCKIGDRLAVLKNIEKHCNSYLKLNQGKEKGRYNHVNTLTQHVAREINTLVTFNEPSDAPVLIGFKC